jgi:hypothetical protein
MESAQLGAAEIQRSAAQNSTIDFEMLKKYKQKNE